MDFTDEKKYIVQKSIQAILPEESVKKAIKEIPHQSAGNNVLISLGKAAWRMAKAALSSGIKFDDGLVVTKYGHSRGELDQQIEIIEAGHPLPDENSLRAAEKAIEKVESLTDKDRVFFLLSGGGSSLFEKPKISLGELENVYQQLLSCGANIVESNIIRKRLSLVKGGRFAELISPAQVYNIILSDVIGDEVDMIASGPTYPDSSTYTDAKNIVEKYDLKLSDKAHKILECETPDKLSNTKTIVSGSVDELCLAAKGACEELGYDATILTTCMTCFAKDAGSLMGSIAYTNRNRKNTAYIFGGETVVNITGEGKGGRNQEIAISASEKISGLENVFIFSFGSDGTDGPTDAAGGYADGNTLNNLKNHNLSVDAILKENDSYNALKAIGGLIVTGPTGTNVNDVSVILIK